MNTKEYMEKMLKAAVTTSKEDAINKCRAVYDMEDIMPFEAIRQEGESEEDFSKRFVNSYLGRLATFLSQMRFDRRNKYFASSEQLRFIASEADRLAVIAGPGSGKSATLMRKIKHQKEVHGWKGSDILAISYTKKSSQDMSKKYDDLMKMYNMVGDFKVKTIHKFGKDFLTLLQPDLQVLTETSKVVTYEYDEVEQQDIEVEHSMYEILGAVLREAGINKENQPMTLTPDKFYSAMSVVSEKMITSDKEFRETDESYLDFPISYEQLMEARKLYTIKKNGYNCTDYMDMLESIYDLLRQLTPRTKDRLKNKALKEYFSYKAIYIDEAQDVSPLQVGIVTELLRLNPGCKLVVVGDDDQAIYRFRGADPSFLLDFAKTFQPQEPEIIDYDPDTDEPIYEDLPPQPTVDIIYLTINRRSCIKIVQASNRLIANNSKRYNKIMRPRKEELGHIEMVADIHGMISKGMILKALRNEAKENRGQLGKIGIIYREHKQVAPILNMLVQYHIPFNSPYSEVSGLYAFNSTIVKDFISILNLCEDMQNHHLIRSTLFKLCPNVTKKDAARISDILLEDSRKKTDKHLKLSTIMKQVPGWSKDIPSLVEVVTAVKNRETMGILVPMIYKKYLDAYFQKLLTDSPGKYEAMVEPSMEFLNAKPELSAYGFKSYVQDTKKWVSGNYNVSNGVALDSEHVSKGLEYNKVFVLEVSDVYTPKATILEQYSEAAQLEYIEEERRALYVAVTRAIDSCTIFYDKENDTNIFVQELFKAINEVNAIYDKKEDTGLEDEGEANAAGNNVTA